MRKLRGIDDENGKTFDKPEIAWLTSFCSPVGLLAAHEPASQAIEMIAVTTE